MIDSKELRQVVKEEVKQALAKQDTPERQEAREDFSLWAMAIAVPTTMFRWTKSAATKAKNAAIMTFIVGLVPLLLLNWIAFPAYMKDLHERGWGPMDLDRLSVGAGWTHGILLVVVILGIVATLIIKGDERRWWWE